VLVLVLVLVVVEEDEENTALLFNSDPITATANSEEYGFILLYLLLLLFSVDDDDGILEVVLVVVVDHGTFGTNRDGRRMAVANAVLSGRKSVISFGRKGGGGGAGKASINEAIDSGLRKDGTTAGGTGKGKGICFFPLHDDDGSRIFIGTGRSVRPKPTRSIAIARIPPCS